MYRNSLIALVALAAGSLTSAQVTTEAYTWASVKTGGGGGFVPNIIFNPSEQGLAYARTDIGGAYRLESNDSWTPLLDWVDNENWHYWGTDALATDPVDTNNLYLAVGMYTNSFDPNNGSILISNDQGNTFTASPLPFKVGGNMPGRGMGERLAVDPHDNSILYFGARSGHGLWKSTDSGLTWTNVTNFPSVGTYIPDPTGYESDIIGIAWVTFDSTSGSSGSPTPRIFVGVANLGSDNIFVSENAGETWAAVAGQNSTFMPHKGVLSVAEETLYVSYSNGAGPYDGTLGSVMKFDIATSTWTDITPVSGSNLYFGFGGLSVDVQTPGTIMVAALNSWWPDGQIFRSLDSGATWKALWNWVEYPTLTKSYTYSDANAPWIGPDSVVLTLGTLQIGWMMEGLSIDPFDSDHFLYGTGETVYGSHDLTSWDTQGSFLLESLADGIEEMSVQNLVAPVGTSPLLLSAVGDDDGFVHTSLSTPPSQEFQTPVWSTAADIDYAGNSPTDFVRLGSDTDSTVQQIAVSSDSGNDWNTDFGAALNVSGGHVAYSANADTVLWSSSTNGVLVSQFTDAFVSVPSLPSGAIIASDKRNDAVFYAASGSSFYLSTDTGHTFTHVSTLGSSTAPVKIVAHPSIAGDVWVSSDQGLFHSTNNGTTFTQISGVTQAWAFALGAPSSSTAYKSIYAAAVISGITGYFRSDNEGESWIQINNANFGFASASSNPITADQNVFGRVYVGTNGRGIFYGQPVNGASSSSIVSSSSASTSTKSASTSSISSTSKTTTISSTVSSTVTKSSSSTATSSTPTSTGVASEFGQCGGEGWTGPTVCVSGWTCVVQNPFFSQCVQT